MYGEVTIYGLRDPSDGSIFYVGRSTRVHERFMQHLSEAERFKAEDMTMLERLFGIVDDSVTVKRKSEKETGKNVRKLRWINQITSRGENVELVILDQWDKCPTLEDANRLEDAWIAKMRGNNQPLTNFLYSRRQEVWWYGESNKNYKVGYARTPDEYIAMLKKGDVGSKRKSSRKSKTGSTSTGRKLNRSQKRRIAKKNYRKYTKKKK